HPTSMPLFFYFYGSAPHPALHSFPTRRSSDLDEAHAGTQDRREHELLAGEHRRPHGRHGRFDLDQLERQVARDLVAQQHADLVRSEEHTSELQSPDHLVCRLLLEKKKNKRNYT